ncbi:MAG: hypothetical protein ACOX8W_12680 [bacterium]
MLAHFEPASGALPIVFRRVESGRAGDICSFSVAPRRVKRGLFGLRFTRPAMLFHFTVAMPGTPCHNLRGYDPAAIEK